MQILVELVVHVLVKGAEATDVAIAGMTMITIRIRREKAEGCLGVGELALMAVMV